MTGIALYDLPPLYDLAIAPGPCESFYLEEARKAGGPILELGCGTGRLTLPLARDGHDVVGLDLSARMLQQARGKAAAQGLDVTFVEGDMRAFGLGRQFALVLVSCNSLAHLTTSAEIRACFECVRRHLSPEGVFAFDIVNPDLRALARSGSRPKRLDLGPNPSSAIAVEEVATYDPVQQVRFVSWRVREPGAAVRDLAPLALRQIFPQELSLLLAASGLELVERYGDFARNPLDGTSLNQICLARAAPAPLSVMA